MTQQTGKPRVLIIDDDESLGKMLRFRLRDAYEILHTTSPEEGLILALQQKPEMILVDLLMPEHTGFEVCQTLAALSFTQRIPVFVISGAPKTLYKDFCFALGAKGYFEKPIDFEAMQVQLAEVLKKAREEQRIEARVRLKIGIRLRGKDHEDHPFEVVAATDDVSRRGFSCSPGVTLNQNAVVEVFLWTRPARRFVGQAHPVWLNWPPMAPTPTYGFRFLEEPREWIF